MRDNHHTLDNAPIVNSETFFFLESTNGGQRSSEAKSVSPQKKHCFFSQTGCRTLTLGGSDSVTPESWHLECSVTETVRYSQGSGRLRGKQGAVPGGRCSAVIIRVVVLDARRVGLPSSPAAAASSAQVVQLRRQRV